MFNYIKALDEDLEVYFNSTPYGLDDATDIKISTTEKRKYFSFIDVESLPGDQWGYTHFPIAADYMDKYNLNLTMMNGKFRKCFKR